MFYFIGIKGTGMASLASILYDLGNDVAGSDLDKHFFTEDSLRERNIPIYSFNPSNIKDNMTVIIGNAFLDDFEEAVAARNNPTCKCYRYHEYLGLLMKDYTSVCIAGSHGKTTTTTLCKNVLSNFKRTGFLIGDGTGHIEQNSEYLCVEADEFRRHFIKYFPEFAIITNIEIDHVDYFKDEIDYFNAYQEFVNQVSNCVFFHGDDEWCNKLSIPSKSYSFGLSKKNFYHVDNYISNSSYSEFDLIKDNQFVYHYKLPMVGDHLIIDVLGVISLADYLHFDHSEIEKSLSVYHGPKRRFVVEEFKNTIFVDDYAHHPTEVKVTLQAAKKRFPDKKIIAIFKPHRASRVKYFVNEFKDALSIADEIFLLDFTSIDDKQDGTNIDISYLANIIPNSKILSEDEIGAKILSNYKNECLVFMSSKDIYNLANITKKFI